MQMAKRIYVLPANRQWIYWPHTLTPGSTASTVAGYTRTSYWDRAAYLAASPSSGWPRGSCCPLYDGTYTDSLGGYKFDDWYFPIPKENVTNPFSTGMPASVPDSHYPLDRDLIATNGCISGYNFTKDTVNAPGDTTRNTFSIYTFGIAPDHSLFPYPHPTSLELWLFIGERVFNVQSPLFRDQYSRLHVLKYEEKTDLSDSNLHFFPCYTEGQFSFDYTAETFRRIYYHRAPFTGTETISSSDGAADPLESSIWSALLPGTTVDWIESVWQREPHSYGCGA